MPDWYVERYDRNGLKAKWHGNLPNFQAVAALVAEVRKAGNVEKLRVTVPVDAAQSDKDAFIALGVEPF
jgi:hypothetical protein